MIKVIRTLLIIFYLIIIIIIAFIVRIISIDSKAQSDLARHVIIQISTQSPGRYTAELPLRRIKLFSFQANSPYVPSTKHIVDFLGSRRMETAPTSIEVLLRPTLGQSDEPSDLRDSLSPTSVYSTWQSKAVTHPIMNRARRCLTLVIEPTPISERRIPYIINW